MMATNEGVGRLLRTALPMNRASLRCLGLTVGIAIALGGCALERDAQAPFEQQEALYAITPDKGARGIAARMAVADGKITFAEVQQFKAEFPVQDTPSIIAGEGK